MFYIFGWWGGGCVGVRQNWSPVSPSSACFFGSLRLCFFLLFLQSQKDSEKIDWNVIHWTPYFYLWEKLAPEVNRESRGTATEDANEVVLECLDGFFSHVVLMVVRGNKFVCHVGVANCLLVCR
jgi:hypothetical protein